MKFYSADYIFSVSSKPLADGVVAVEDDGEIIGVYANDDPKLDGQPILQFEGIITPGFVNSHCHLELSYLKNKIPKGLGLIEFIKTIINTRSKQVNEQEILDSIEKADKLMEANGIVAVGDISNVVHTKETKQGSNIYYHTFIELLAFQPEKAKQVFDQGLKLREGFAPLPASLVPHAPYSVSKDLLRAIFNLAASDQRVILSMHNQESEEENKLFRYKTGAFLDFYKSLDVGLDFFKAQARNSLQTLLPLFPEGVNTLFVHNTYTSLKGIYFVKRFGRNVNWCFCPNANLYIEGRLPKIDLFLSDSENITVGTDSLASNGNLCILSELKAIHAAFPELKFADTLSWATINGARFLKIDDRFGTIEKGKRPGLNLISHFQNGSLTPDSVVKKLV